LPANLISTGTPPAAEFANHLRGSTVGARRVHLRAAFLVRGAVVQNLPHEPTEAMGDGANRLRVAETADQAPVDQLEEAALGS
jgi:hypothetical protein